MAREANRRVLSKGQRDIAASIFGKVVEGSRKEAKQQKAEKGKTIEAAAKDQGGDPNNGASPEE